MIYIEYRSWSGFLDRITTNYSFFLEINHPQFDAKQFFARTIWWHINWSKVFLVEIFFDQPLLQRFIKTNSSSLNWANCFKKFQGQLVVLNCVMSNCEQPSLAKRVHRFFVYADLCWQKYEKFPVKRNTKYLSTILKEIWIHWLSFNTYIFQPEIIIHDIIKRKWYFRLEFNKLNNIKEFSVRICNSDLKYSVTRKFGEHRLHIIVVQKFGNFV